MDQAIEALFDLCEDEDVSVSFYFQIVLSIQEGCLKLRKVSKRINHIYVSMSSDSDDNNLFVILFKLSA